jgi:protein-disulfide isomerase
MKRSILLIGIMVVLAMGCTITNKSQQEGKGSPQEAISVDVTGLNDKQQEDAKNMIDEIIPLIKEGKTESQVIQYLQEQDAKKITRYRVEVGDSPTKGPANAKVTIVEYTDFQCPFCAKVQPTLTKILEKYPQDVRKVFKQHPLSFHKDAPLAAEASLAAGGQGKFWEMKEVLFNNQKQLKEENLIKYAQELGLDLEQFKSDLSTHKYKAQVDRETEEAVKLGATGTPAFFVNGRYLSGAKPLESFVAVIDEELSGKKIPFKWGTNVKDERKQTQKTQRPAEDPNKIYTMPVGSSPFKGPKDAKVTVVMFQDFQCPFSNRSQPTVKQLMELYPDKVKLVFKNFPLNFHKQAEIAAEAALAAGAQGKFWEMHDKIFANQKNISLDILKGYAKELNLDMNKFNQDLDTHTYKKTIDEDMKLATGAGVRGTPTFFINGKKLVGAKPVGEFQKVIDAIN